MPDDDKPQGGDNKAEALQKLLDKNNGDAQRTLGILFSENFDLREKNRKLKEQVPADGSVVLKKEDADRLTAFDALGLKPEDAKKKIDGAAEVEKERDRLQRETSLREVADAGYSFDALRDFDALEPGLEYVVKDETKDGKTVKSVAVKVDGKERPLDEYAAEKRPAQAKILRESGQTGGKSYVNQDAGGRAPAGNDFDKIRERVKAEDAQKGKGAGSYRERFGLAKPA